MAYARRGKNGSGDYGGTYQKRTAWTAEEDEILKQQVARFGTHCWPEVASGLAGRTSKACSLRWRCFLSPNIIRPNDEPFSPWEIAVIVLTQKVFGNKWNDIAAYLPMRCNNDIKNYFNLYLKDKSQVYSENVYLRSGYDLSQLLASEPDEVAQRRQRLEADKATTNNIDPLKTNRSMSPVPRKPSTPTKAKKSSSGSSTPTIRGGVVKGSGSKPSRMALASTSLAAVMSEAYGIDEAYAAAAYGAHTDASGMYHDMAAAAAAAAAGQGYMSNAHMTQGIYSPAAAGGQASAAGYTGYYHSAAMATSGAAVTAAAYGYTGAADSYTLHMAADGTGSCIPAEQQQQQQQQQPPQQPQQQQQHTQQQSQQQQPQLMSTTLMDMAAAAATSCPEPAAFNTSSSLFPPALTNNAYNNVLSPAEPSSTAEASKAATLQQQQQQHGSPVCLGSPESDAFGRLMRFSIGDPDNILPLGADACDPIGSAMGVHWHRITSVDGTDFDSLLSDGELQAEYQLRNMLAEYESVSSKPHSQSGGGVVTSASPGAVKAEAAAPPAGAQQDAAAAAAAVREPTGVQDAAGGAGNTTSAGAPMEASVLAAAAPPPPTAAGVHQALAAGLVGSGAHSLGVQACTSPAAAAAAAAAAVPSGLHPALHVDVPSPTVSWGPGSQRQQLPQPLQQQQQRLRDHAATASPRDTVMQLKTGSSSGSGSHGGSIGGSGSPATTHLSSVNIHLGLVNPAISHLVAGGERNATSAPCTMVAAYTPNGSYSPNPALPKGAFTQGPLRPASPPRSWQQQQQVVQQQLAGMPQRPSPFNDLQHQQQHLTELSGAWGPGTPTSRQHMLPGDSSTTSSHQQLHLALPPRQQQHLQGSSLLGSPATPGPAAAGAAGAAAVFGGAVNHTPSSVWASSPGTHSSQQQQQQSAAAAAAAAINSAGRWSQHNDGGLPLVVTADDDEDLANLFDGDDDGDVTMTQAPAAAAHSAPTTLAGCVDGTAGDVVDAQDQAKLESLIQELQVDSVTHGRLSHAPLAAAEDLMDLPAWGSSSSGSLDLLTTGW